jgi:hypothetical protein
MAGWPLLYQSRNDLADFPPERHLGTDSGPPGREQVALSFGTMTPGHSCEEPLIAALLIFRFYIASCRLCWLLPCLAL